MADNLGFESENRTETKTESDIETNYRPNNDGKLVFKPEEKLRIYKNLGVVSVSLMLLYSAYIGTVNLQSTLNTQAGLGTLSLGLVYISLLVSSIFLPSYFIKTFSAKWCIFIGVVGTFPYIIAQLQPTFYTFIPSAILTGVTAAPMWAALQTYLTQAGQVYSVITQQVADVIITRFFGIFFLFWQTCDLWGNLLSSLILTNPATEEGEPNYEICGSDFCLSDAVGEVVARPPDSEIYLLIGTYLALIVVVCLLVAFLLDPLSRYGEKRGDGGGVKELMFATFRQMKKTNQQLLIPATIFVGMEQAFMAADYSSAFVSCVLSINWIGYVLLTFGLSAAIFSPICGTVMEYLGRMPVVIFGTIAHLSVFLYSIYWEPMPDEKFKFFLVAGVFGMGDGIWQTFLNGFYGSLFRKNKEAAFSNYRLWEAFGYTLSYVTTTYICMRTKLILLSFLVLLSFIGYVFCEYRYRNTQRRITLMSIGSLKDRQMAQQEIQRDDAHDPVLEEKVMVMN